MDKLQLYRVFMKLCRKFDNYTFREYFLRKTREDFRSNDLNLAKLNLFREMLVRQTTIQSLYPVEKSVIETKKPARLGAHKV